MTSVQYNPPHHLCQPPPARCRTRNYPLFSPPIASRRIPLCRPVYCEGIQEGDPNLNVNRMGTLDRVDWLRGWVAVQLFTRGQVECGNNPPYTEPPYIPKGHPRLGGWWADSFRGDRVTTARGAAFRSGSKLWTLQWNHVTNQTLMQAKEFAFEAISYLVSWGIATKIDIVPWYISRRVMRLDITIHGPGVGDVNITVQGSAMPDSRYLWEEYKRTPNIDSLGQRYPRSVPTIEANAA